MHLYTTSKQNVRGWKFAPEQINDTEMDNDGRESRTETGLLLVSILPTLINKCSTESGFSFCEYTLVEDKRSLKAYQENVAFKPVIPM